MSEVPPEGYIEDDQIWPIMEQLQQCMCETLTERGLMPGNCFCGIFPGDSAPWDYQDGMAWIRLVDAYPSTTFPNPNTTPRISCGAMMVATLEVGAINCAPIISAQGALPTMEEQKESARLQAATMRALKDAIACCDLDLVVLGNFSPVGPQGGLVGGSWQINVGAE